MIAENLTAERARIWACFVIAKRGGKIPLDQLRRWCREAGFADTGKRAALVARLQKGPTPKKAPSK